MEPTFPPPLKIGSRVWSNSGYRDHGPLQGPKVDIPPGIGGAVVDTQRPYMTMDQLLYSVRWDNGQFSKHYFQELFCIGRYQTRSEFEAAINLTGPVEVVIGPQGGFRKATMNLMFDGQAAEGVVYERHLWFDWLEPLARKNNATISTVQLPPAPRGKRSK